MNSHFSGKCPVYSSTGHLDSKACHSTILKECPSKVYRSNEAFNCKFFY